eukprot:13435661-Alexandrium_andersonii.AAC.1
MALGSRGRAVLQLLPLGRRSAHLARPWAGMASRAERRLSATRLCVLSLRWSRRRPWPARSTESSP